jgi:glucokinase
MRKRKGKKMPKLKEEYVVGIDLGGTKIYAAVVNQNGDILATARKKTKFELGFDKVVERITNCAKLALQKSGISLEQIKGVGVGSPGPLDLVNGKIIETPNLKWKDAPLRDRLLENLNLPVKIDNDGNVGILGENIFGAGKNAKHMVGLFVGTGIGGGIIVDGKILHGFNENAGELGHMILDPSGPVCGCGNNGCLEAFASRLSIEREIRVAALHGEKTTVFNGMDDKNDRLRSKRLAEAYKNQDTAVTAAINKSAKYIGFGVASLLNIFNPEVVVIGGGVVEAIGQPYVDLVKQTAEQNVFPIALRNVEIVPAKLGDDSAVLGASVLAW